MDDASASSDDLSDFAAYSHDHLPGMVELEILAAIDSRLQNSESISREMIGNIVRKCQETIHDNWIHRSSTHGKSRLTPEQSSPVEDNGADNETNSNTSSHSQA